MKDRELLAILILNAPVALALTLAIWIFFRLPRTDPFYFAMTFGLTFYVLFVLGLLGAEWLSKGGTVRNQIRKTFRLKRLDLKTSGLAEFFHADFTIPERLSILSFLIGLAASLGTWILFEYWTERVVLTILAFIGVGFGLWYLTLPISTRYYRKIVEQRDSELKTLNLEGKSLTEFNFEVPDIIEIQKINLGGNELKAIDLKPLADSSNLTDLILYWNHLESIDLTPLASCPNLEYLDLAENNLRSVNLTPLASCKKLNALNLGGNETSSIDLKPLSKLRKLKILTIDDMHLKEVDLEPLRNCKKLEFLKLNDNELKTLDVTPLFECQELSDFEIDDIELTTTIDRDIETWPSGLRKHRKKFRKS